MHACVHMHVVATSPLIHYNLMNILKRISIHLYISDHDLYLVSLIILLIMIYLLLVLSTIMIA